MESKKLNPTPVATTQDFPIIGIGASAGGLEAFKQFVKAIPLDSGMAYVFVQHLDPMHKSMLAEIIARMTKVPVNEITDDIHLAPDHIYVIPSNKILTSTNGVLKLSPRRGKTRNLPIDVFFSSLAEVHLTLAVGIVLSGLASDGTLGLKAIKAHGGITFAQDQQSAAHGDMPQNAVNAGVVDFVLPPEKIPEKLLKIMQNYREVEASGEVEQKEEAVCRQIIAVLMQHSGVDFTYYKQTTIRRRIARRMAIAKTDKLTDYLKFLKSDPDEKVALFNDVLIPVTSFFRDSKIFQTVSQKVFPAILKNKAAGESIRIWVPGCSIGAEVYSIAIALSEFLANTFSGRRIQIFASDISDQCITKARIGIYSVAELEKMPPDLLEKYFTKSNDGYQVNRNIRDMCVFALHNFLKDPPFAKMDMISCRNVLIYMNSFLQKKALATFHYALKENGFLVLGKSETPGSSSELFSPFAKEDKIYSRKQASGHFLIANTMNREERPVAKERKVNNPEVKLTDFRKSAETILLSKYTPASVIVDEEMNIVHIHGTITPFLEPSQGKPTFNLIKMAREGLAFELRNTLHKAKTTQGPAIKEDILIRSDEKILQVALEIIPLENTADPHYLILFHKTLVPEKIEVTYGGTSAEKIINDEALQRIEQLEKELSQTREDMRAITEDQEATNEEQQSANEELLSSNEEMQSLNEEMETSKEELQSTNEELIIVNQELIDKQEQINNSRLYSEAIIATIHEPLVILDKDLCIKRINNAFCRQFKVTEEESQKVYFYEIKNKTFNNPVLIGLLKEVLSKKNEFNAHEVVLGECTMLMNARPVLNEQSNEQLILLAIEDITEKKAKEIALIESEQKYKVMVETAPDAIIITNEEGLIEIVNAKAEQLFGYGRGELYTNKIEMLIPECYHPDHVSQRDDYLRDPKSQEMGAERELFATKKDGTEFPVEVSLSYMETKTGTRISSAIRDVTERKIIEKKLKTFNAGLEFMVKLRTRELTAINNELEQFAYLASHDLQEPLRTVINYSNLIQKTYKDSLDENATKYFEYLVEATTRMQMLITGILEFTSLNNTESLKMEDCNNILSEVLLQMNATLKESGALIKAGHLPIVKASFQLRSLFQNLISNAIKYRKKDTAPVISVSAMERNNDWLFSVQDNGIGIEKRYFEKIFLIFQKLHHKNEYIGTGIGLAYAKKIVESHGGEIWVESEIGVGSTFYFTIPKIAEKELLPVTKDKPARLPVN
ncbi:MAG: PAS domain S-box protein [Bacteroidota bacterium]|nr:PAS domain S-box protein [Bacteroidota bacterium]